MNSSRRQTLKLVFLSILGVSAVLAVSQFWPRPYTTHIWTSPSLNSKGTRLAINVPWGWEVTGVPTASGFKGLESGEVPEFTVQPTDNLHRAPSWVRRLLLLPRSNQSSNDGLFLRVEKHIPELVGSLEDTSIYAHHGLVLNRAGAATCSQTIGYDVIIDYWCKDDRVFHATHQAVCRSHLVTK
jgi:hypothetical protein